MNLTSPVIRVLPPGIAERIAAGEVIERPASVVKELVENALDAGATEVAVVLEDGGKQLIEVLDNGCGMNAPDLAVAIKRHATSKLTSLEDLERIRTLGFRGEALPSVAAVAELSLLSRTAGSDQAFELIAGAPGESRTHSGPDRVTFGHFLHSEQGTRIRARGLFSQIPARLKFLKSQGAEVAHVREWLERIAISHAHAGFRLVSDDRTVLNLRPASEKDRIRGILSDGEDFPIVTGERDDPGLKVRVHWLQGLSTPQTRKLVQVVNGRAVRDRLLQQALLGPFRQALLPGQFPAVALYIEIDPSELDVNVHPTKTEIRFLNSRRVFHAVQSLVDSLISKHGAIGFAAGQAQGQAYSAFQEAPSAASSAASWSFAPTSVTAPATDAFPFAARPAPLPTQEQWSAAEPAGSAGMSTAPAAHPLLGARFAGFLFNTYLLYEHGNELTLVDQHAADERIRYERLQKRVLQRAPGTQAPAQSLLLPEAVRFGTEDRLRVEERLPCLTALGFEAELFGEETLLFRAVPAEWNLSALRTRLKNLVDRLISYEGDSAGPGQLLLDEALFEALASEACHSAVRAGDRLEPLEAQQLVDDLFRCEHPWNCPHGRPTLARVPRARFEEWFHRRV